MKCDELKPIHQGSVELGDYYVYDADEVDAAIAELKAKLESVQASAYAESVDAGMENRKLKAIRSGEIYNIIEYEDCYRTDDLYYLKSEADKVIARHKYKRCLAMAEKCDARYDEEDAKVNGHAASWEYISKEMKYWERWRNRWLAIAEKFKEGVCRG